jgi:very-short-patch-repair endonuclease
MSVNQKILIAYFAHFGIPEPVAEFRFHPERKWRFDYAWPDHRVALEVEGGAWSGGRHTRGAGFIADLEKYNEANADGWNIIRVTPQQLMTANTISLIKRTIA